MNIDGPVLSKAVNSILRDDGCTASTVRSNDLCERAPTWGPGNLDMVLKGPS